MLKLWLLAVVLWPVLGAFISYVIGRYHKKARDFFVCFVTGSQIIILILRLLTEAPWQSVSAEYPDICGVGLTMTVDGFRWLYALIAALMWFMTALMSGSYFRTYRNRNRYYLFFLMTLGATEGVFLSGDLMTTFIFFEVMSMASYVWVAQDEKKASMRAAETYMAIAVIGGLVMLMGLFLLYHLNGTLDIAALKANSGRLLKENPAALYTAGGLILFGFGAKAGMFPLHIWLPKAHPAAPAPASALLSGILTKAGIYGTLILMLNVFAGDMAFGTVLYSFGMVTMVSGAVLALFSIDLKRTLACSSISQIGFILSGIGLIGILGNHNRIAVWGTILHMMNHSLFKLILFMCAGVIFMNLHRLNLNEIRGWGKDKPLLKLVFLAGAAGISGIPLFSGYISKTLLHEGLVEALHAEGRLIEQTWFWHGTEAVFLLTGGLTVAYMLKLYTAIFTDKSGDCQEEKRKESGPYMDRPTAAALAAAALAVFVMGSFPHQTMERLAKLSEEFFYLENGSLTVHYSAFANIKGAVISIAAGILIYALVVRKLLMTSDEAGKTVYKDRWPVWLDIEDKVYRPFLLGFLVPVFSAVCRILDHLVDGIVVGLRQTTHRQLSAEKEITGDIRIGYAVGTAMDKGAYILNHSVLKKRKIKKKFAEDIAQKEKRLVLIARIIETSVSFGLLLFCVGFVAVLAYLLLF